VPRAGGDQSLYAPKERGIELQYPLVDQRLVMVENEAVVALAEIRGGAEGGKHFRGSFLDLPQPRRIEVRIADEMNLHDRPLCVGDETS
jgi:hypothetical protein